MADSLDLKIFLKHLANGSLSESLCVVCLQSISDEGYENIHTLICKKNEEYCIAQVLKEVCNLQFEETDNYNVCINCFHSATTAYQFYLKAKRSHSLITSYTDQILFSINGIQVPEENQNCLLCIPVNNELPCKPFDYNLDGIGLRNMGDLVSDDESDDEVILIIQDKEDEVKLEHDSNSENIDDNENDSDSNDNVLMIVNEKTRKKRDPMISVSCMHCPVRYRFLSKLRDHVKKVHKVDIYYCRICKLITDKQDKYAEHILTHVGQYQCSQCHAVFRKQEHLTAHEEAHNLKKELASKVSGTMCEVCGIVVADAEALAAHAERHSARRACFYCGRVYRAQGPFEAHIRKHEQVINRNNKQRKSSPKEIKETDNTRSICGVCGKSFVDDRALLWHQRLHDNERPFPCDVCGRRFVTESRRNQHALCSHSRPARRCPLCPALFHLTSMVNTHVKKVHLNKTDRRRRNRAPKQEEVFWKTETVPIQELSVSIQNEVLEMQTCNESVWDNPAESTKKKIAKKVRKCTAKYKEHDTLPPLVIEPEDLPDQISIQEFDAHEFNEGII